jgi:hypothetical protein
MLPTGADDADTVTFTVAPSRAAALIGAGFYGAPIVNNTFGSPDFKAYNLNVENRYANYSAGQALALGVSYANASFVSNEDFRGMSATQGLTSSVRSLVRMCFPIVSRYYLCWTVWFSVL